ncbi:MFS transporter [Endomicrobium proavitum]|uniref:Multidrug or homocysteine efflux system n=1 Tax=Endomicrobium proavitum TaxID=1408281 RepID=A0A0G3WKJ6_9BACT|nr:MFS transporter [Endomicrobium proavitum]AKL98430.1 multidrug or homocysteine efflux system [Endomicrobium proavitum]
MKTYSQEFKIKLMPWLAATALFMQMLDGSVLNTALPAIADSLGENPLQMQSSVISYLLAVAIFLPVSGWFSDKFGIKKAFLFAISVFTLGSFCCAMSGSLLTLSLSRILQGAGGAFLVPVARLAVLRVSPRDQYANVLSFMVLPALIGPLIGPTLGGFLVQYASWHWIFLINIPVGFLCFFATIYLMPKIDSLGVPAKFDFKGFLLIDAAILFLSAVSFSENIIGNFSNWNFALIALAFAAFYYFYARNRKNAIFNIAMFKIPSFAIGIAGNIFIRIVGGAFPFLAPLFFQTALGWTPSKSGMMMIPMGIAALFAKTFAAPLILKAGYKKFLIGNTLFLSTFILAAGFIGFSTPLWVIVVLYSFIGMANSLQFTAINTLALIDVPDKLMSRANNLLSVSFQISISLGVAIAALLLAKTGGIGFVAAKQNVLLEAFHLTYIIVSAISVIGAALFIFIPKSAGTKIASIENNNI